MQSTLLVTRMNLLDFLMSDVLDMRQTSLIVASGFQEKWKHVVQESLVYR